MITIVEFRVKQACLFILTNEFPTHMQIGGVPMVKMYKPNGEHIDYMGQLQASKYELIPVLLRNFVAVNVFGESITHPCINFECEYYRLMHAFDIHYRQESE